jgi:polyphosphate kinase
MSSKSKKSAYLLNRELSWLKFNERVLDEAAYEPRPLFGRLRFISIFTSNLDEFYMVRVGSLTDYMLYHEDYVDSKTGMSAKRQLQEISEQVMSLYTRRDEMYDSLKMLLGLNGVRHYAIDDLTETEIKELQKNFKKNILPLLSPQIVDMTHPFPHLLNKQLHIAVHLEGKHKTNFGLIPLPKVVERVQAVRSDGFVLLEDVILRFCDEIFNMYNILEKNVIAVTRNADVSFDDDDKDIEDYRQHVKKIIKKRSILSPVRLEIQYPANEDFLDFFTAKLNMAFPQVLLSTSPLDYSFCDGVERMFSHRAELMAPSHTPLESIPDKTDMLELISRRDVLLSFPYESISPFISLIQEAIQDKSVASIKITLYRIDFHSKLALLLMQAVDNGKEVVVLMELRARFDENNNIQWAEALEQAGCKVVYGISDYKVHSKVCLITRIQNGAVHYITQIGTGNYNEKTSKLYTDLSIMTANQEIGNDAAKLFHNLLVGNLSDTYSKLLVAPSTLKSGILRHLDEEIEKANTNLPAHAILKCNSITDRDIIEKLVEASIAGVKIQLIVRGICCLIPMVTGFTENITVRSIVGRFLEHPRIYCFGTGEDASIYIGSADLMTRNTEDRVEVACPILDKTLHAQIRDMLAVMLKDNVKAWELLSDGRYVLNHPDGGEVVNCQEYFTMTAKMQDISAIAPPAPAKVTLPAKQPQGLWNKVMKFIVSK